jgi:hypothetical protein
MGQKKVELPKEEKAPNPALDPLGYWGWKIKQAYKKLVENSAKKPEKDEK